MTLEERVAAAVRSQTESLPAPATDLSVIRSTARAQSRRRAAFGVLGVAVAVLAVAFSGVTDMGQSRSGIRPAAPPSSTPTPSATSEAIDTTGWTTYTSSRYDLDVGHPSDWTVVPSSRRWTYAADVGDWLSPAQEVFVPPDDDVRVSVWSVPLAAGTTIESTDDIVAWVRSYCEESGSRPCTGIAQRAVPMCLERRDCHPAVLVPFTTETEAFFTGGIYDSEAMTVVAVWRGENDPSVAPYGGSRRLLEAFLETMEVWPASS